MRGWGREAARVGRQVSVLGQLRCEVKLRGGGAARAAGKEGKPTVGRTGGKKNMPLTRACLSCRSRIAQRLTRGEGCVR